MRSDRFLPRAFLTAVNTGLTALAVAAILAALVACAPDDNTGSNHSVHGQTMGTTYSIQVPSAAKADLASLQDDIELALEQLNAALSTYRADSAISRFNLSRSTDWFTVPESLAEVAAEATLISRASDGAFDSTVAPLLKLWGFGADGDTDAPPDSAAIGRARQESGYQHLQVQLDPPALKKALPGLELDLSAIAKGYAVDALAMLLQRRGYDDYLVEIGGDLRVSGQNREGGKWMIGVENPLRGAPTGSLALSRGGVATSGDYRNYIEHAGKRFSHIIDPRSGRPVDHMLASVTVVQDNAMLADGWATALMVLGGARGLELADRLDIAAFFIVRTADGFETLSSRSYSQLESR